MDSSLQTNLFEFIRDNLRLTIESNSGRDYLRCGQGLESYTSYRVKLLLTI